MNPDADSDLEYLVGLRAELGRLTGCNTQLVYYSLRNICRNIDRRIQRGTEGERTQKKEVSVTQ